MRRRFHDRAVVPLLALMLAVTAILVPGAQPALAATIQVTTSTDENGTGPACSLREAVTAANTNVAFGGCGAGDVSGVDQITFAAGTDGNTVTLTAGEITISSSLSISGNGVSQTRVSGNNASRVFSVTAGTVSLSGLTVRDGSTTGNGGGVRTLLPATLTLTNTIVSGNVARFGGGIHNGGALTIANSTISGNVVMSGDGSPTSGGGINSQGSLSITSSTISGNTAGFSGGGITNVGGLTVTNSTFSGNSAPFSGGGLENVGTATVISSTFSGNVASLGSSVNNLVGTAQLRASVLDAEIGLYSGGNCFGSLTSRGSNLSTDATCAAFLTQPEDVNGVTALNLGPLGDNGGPTRTHALLAGSVAIDAVNGNCTSDGTPGGTPISLDQRGNGRPQGSQCDVGAFEADAGTPGAPGTLQFSAAAFSVNESGPTASVTVTRTGGTSGTVGATISLADGTATAPADYTATAIQVGFAAGDAAPKVVVIPIVDDLADESDETVTLTLANPTGGATVGVPSSAVLTIVDNDGPSVERPGQLADEPAPKAGKEDQATRETEEQRLQREHTNRGNRDDVATEGNVIQVRVDADPPYIVIANRDGLVTVRLRCGSQCPAIHVGDYVEIDGEKVHEQLYEAEQVTVVR